MPKYWVPCKCLDAKIGFFWIYSWDCFEMTFNLIDKKKPAQNNSEAISWNVASSDGEIFFKEQMAENVLNHKYISPFSLPLPLPHCFVKVWCYFPTVVIRQWVIDSHPDTWPIKLVWPWTLFPHLLKTLQTLLHSLWGLLQINWSSIISSVMHFPSSSSFPVSNIISTHGMHEKNGNIRHKLFEIDKTVSTQNL